MEEYGEATTKPEGRLCCYIHEAPKRFNKDASPVMRQGNHAKLQMAAETRLHEMGRHGGRKCSTGPWLSALGVMEYSVRHDYLFW